MRSLWKLVRSRRTAWSVEALKEFALFGFPFLHHTFPRMNRKNAMHNKSLRKMIYV